MIIAILPDASTTEILLNNLSEADFNLSDVSVVMRDLKTRRAIAPDTGPLKGVSPKGVVARLTEAGLSQQDARRCGDAVAQGKVLVAMTVPTGAEQAAKEMIQDHSGQVIEE